MPTITHFLATFAADSTSVETIDDREHAEYCTDMSDFSDRVRAVVRAIPKGEVRTYGEVARLAGSPRAARAVGTVMAGNFDETVPCHRVIAANGYVGNYNRGETPDAGRAMKIAILKKEGVAIVDGRVRLKI